MTDDDLLDRFEREFKEFSESGRSVVFPNDVHRRPVKLPLQ